MCTLAFPLPLCTAHAHTYTVIHMHARHIDIAMHSGFNLYHNGNRDLFERPKNGKAHSVFCDEAGTGVGSAFLYICRAMAHFTNPNPFARPNPSAQPTQEDSTESMTVFCRPSTTRTVQRICLALPSAPFQHKFCKRSRTNRGLDRLCKRSRTKRGLGASQRNKRRIGPGQGGYTDAHVSVVTSTASSV